MTQAQTLVRMHCMMHGNPNFILRMALIMGLVAGGECLVVFMVAKPLHWLGWVGMLLPILTSLFVIRPLIKLDEPSPPIA